jgi:hypothetical protein
VYSRVSPFLEELEALALPNVLFSAVPGSVDVPSDVGFVCHGDADTCQTVAFKSGAEINSRSLDSSRAPIQEDASPTSEIRMNSFRRDATEGPCNYQRLDACDQLLIYWQNPDAFDTGLSDPLSNADIQGLGPVRLPRRHLPTEPESQDINRSRVAADPASGDLIASASMRSFHLERETFPDSARTSSELSNNVKVVPGSPGVSKAQHTGGKTSAGPTDPGQGAFGGTFSQPIANDDTYGVHAGSSLTIAAPGILSNDVNPGAEAPSLSATLNRVPLHGILSFDGTGWFSYTPDPTFVGLDSFQYFVDNGIFTSNPATVTLNVHSVNGAPVPVNDSYTVVHNQVLTVPPEEGVLANDSDPDRDPLTARLANGPGHGGLTLNQDGSFTYSPVSGYVGPDSFTYTANDGLADSQVATIRIDVANTQPAVASHSYTVKHDTTLPVSSSSGLLSVANDLDGDPLTLSQVDSPSHGVLNVQPDGSFTYAPFYHYYGPDSFTYKVNDGFGDSNIGRANIQVTESAPMAVDIFLNPPFVSDLDGNVLLDFGGTVGYDLDGDKLTAKVLQTTQHGTLVEYGDDLWKYTPEPGYVGPDPFTYLVNDGILDSNPATAVINLTDGQTPVADPDSYAVVAGHDLNSDVGVLENDTWQAPDTVTIIPGSGPLHGTLLSFDVMTGKFLYHPDPGYTGPDSFTYSLHDNMNGKESAPTAVTIQVITASLDMDGVGKDQKLDPGGFIGVNANNDNGSRVTDAVPVLRDYQTSDFNADDPQLRKVAISVDPAAPAATVFTVSVSATGSGRISLWDTASKKNKIDSGTKFAKANLPAQVFVEGMAPSEDFRDLTLTLTTSVVLKPIGKPVPFPIGTDNVAVTITPVVTAFGMTPGTVTFVNGRNGQGGLRAGQGGNNPGAAFSAQVTREGIDGYLGFVQNVTSKRNGTHFGSAGGFVFLPGTGRNPQNSVLRPGNTYPILDRLNPNRNDQNTAFPLYDVHYEIGNPEFGVTQTAFADDSPMSGRPGGMANQLDIIDITIEYQLYLVWRFEDGIIYSLGYLNWVVQFYATQAVTNLQGSRIFVENNAWYLDHDDPARTPRTYNQADDIQ